MENWLDKELLCDIHQILGEVARSTICTDVSLGLSICKKNKWLRSVLSYEVVGGQLERVSEKLFDLASLTKPVVTSLSLLRLLEEGEVALQNVVGEIIKDTKPPHCNLKIVDLLNHRAGLPAHQEYFHKLLKLPKDKRSFQIQKMILSEPLVFSPGKQELYSDLGYIILGQIIEIVSKESMEK